MMKSDTISNLVTALVAAQAEFAPIVKTETASIAKRNGGQFSYKYSNLHQVIESTRSALLKNGLVILQSPTTGQGTVSVETTLAHVSGEYMTETLTMPITLDTPQSVGSGITYARRFAWLAILGLAAQDDDGAEASKKPVAKTTTEPAGYEDWKTRMILASRSGMVKLQAEWGISNKAFKAFARDHDAQWWTATKASVAVTA